jgi:hypothetical protein
MMRSQSGAASSFALSSSEPGLAERVSLKRGLDRALAVAEIGGNKLARFPAERAFRPTYPSLEIGHAGDRRRGGVTIAQGAGDGIEDRAKDQPQTAFGLCRNLPLGAPLRARNRLQNDIDDTIGEIWT